MITGATIILTSNMSQIETQNWKKSQVWQREHETQTGLWAPYMIHIQTYKYIWKCKISAMMRIIWWTALVNPLRPRQNGRHFAGDIFKCIFLNENVWIPIKISQKFVPKDPINNIPALVQIMAWRRPGDKPLSEPMVVILPTHICVTRSQWVNSFESYHVRFLHWCIEQSIHSPGARSLNDLRAYNRGRTDNITTAKKVQKACAYFKWFTVHESMLRSIPMWFLLVSEIWVSLNS